MLRIADIRYRTKLLWISGAAVAGILSLAAVSFVTINRVKIGSETYKLVTVDRELAGDLTPAALSLEATQLQLLHIEDAIDPSSIPPLVQKAREAHRNFDRQHAYYMERVRHPKLRAMLNGKVYEAAQKYFQLMEGEYLPLVEHGEIDKARELRHSQMLAIVAEQQQPFEEFIATVGEVLHQREEDSAKVVADAERLTMLVAAIVLFGVGLLVLRISTHIQAQVTKIRDAARALEAGDLRHRIEGDSQDELGDVGRALNASFQSLGQAIGEINRHSCTLANASEEISSSAGQVSDATELQRQQVIQVASAMQEMASTVQQVSDNSQHAASNLAESGRLAGEGGRVVEETVEVIRGLASSTRATAEKIEELGRSSDSIGKIVGTIDDIADQTNLLALNAAIEAARAGEQGRGFAVVADEVRKLAERTSAATKEIAAMIQTIQRETRLAVESMRSGTGKVDAGVEAAGKAGVALRSIIDAAGRQHEMITQIATASTQQAAAADQVTSNMEEISKMVQQSAISAEESAKACQDLSAVALDLQQVVARFHLSGEHHAQRAVPHHPSRPAAPLYDLASLGDPGRHAMQ